MKVGFAVITMQWTSLDIWIVVIASLCGCACALLGNYLVLRRLSMMGDAISHAILPGLAGAFLLTGSRASLPMFIGAAVVGVLTALLTEWVRRFGKVDEGASMGVVFTALFALGLIMIRRAADKVDLDADCVLYGALELVVLDTVGLGGVMIPRPVLTLGVVLLINAVFVGLFFKELRISAFDPELATTLGINASIMHYLLMTLVAITAVASFEVIGNILVVAMLIVPSAAAYLLTDKLRNMVLISLVIAVASAVLGHIAAMTIPTWFGYTDTRTAGAMAATTGVIFIGALLFAPRQGIASRLVHRTLLSLRIAQEDVLGNLYRQEERPDEAIDYRDGVHGPVWLRRLAVLRLAGARLIDRSGDHLALTDRGRATAAELLRSHRLWESFLADRMAIRPDHTHGTAERLEHITDRAMRRRLREDTLAPDTDPQGRPIPPEQ